jgi:gliding motility-associated-like protein
LGKAVLVLSLILQTKANFPLRKLLTVFLLLLRMQDNAQTGFWAQGSGGNNVDESMGVCKDAGGNYITAGYFSNTAYFGQGNPSLTAASIGIPDIYVQKTSAAGQVLWEVKAGGQGTDRALAVACDNAGNIYITGFYYGTATFGSFTLTSLSGSQDMFVAKLSAAGTFLWVKSAGGTSSEWGNSLAVDNNGNIFVVGQFKGNCSWGSISKTSMVNPASGLPSFDIFTAKYDNAGNEIWVETGSAEFDDRALDVAIDNSGNVFVCGQFSDTITFDVVHNNPVANAIFLVKYDTNGQEQWFRRASSSYSICYALTIDNQQNVFITGDFQGNMVFYGTPNNFLSNAYANGIFVARYSNSGSFSWADADGSNSYLSSRDCAVDAQNNVYLAGEFGCVMDEYSAQYGTGIFNSIGFQDIFCVKYSDTGVRQWFRQFGGPGNDKAHGIVTESTDQPVITGSYQKRLNLPSSAGYSVNYSTYAIPDGGQGPQGLSTSLCGDNSYFYYQSIGGAGFSDAFLVNGIDLNREPYDYYNHYTSNCQRDSLETCITDYPDYFSCSDTIHMCYNGRIFANTNTGEDGIIGPWHHFQWNTGPSDTLQYLQVFNSGYYSINVNSNDGCFISEDSVYVIVHPLPQPPLITDDHGYNLNQGPATDTVMTCVPDTVLLSASNLQSCSLSWTYTPYTGYWNSYYCYVGGTPVSSNDSLAVLQTGIYSVTLTDSFGCERCNNVLVKLDTILPLIPKTNFPDSLEACYGDYVPFQAWDSITNPSGSFPHPCIGDISIQWITSPVFGMSSQNIPCSLSGGFYAYMTTGNYTITEMIVRKNFCQNDTFWIVKNFYIKVNPKPVPVISVTGGNFICPGDTLTWQVSVTSACSSCTTTVTPGPGTLYITAAGYYNFTGTATDTVTGCFSYNYFPKLVTTKPDPVIAVNPTNGIICPNDSAQVYTSSVGLNYEWYGPNGLLSPNQQYIYDSVPGYYHCVVTDSAGCVLTSNTIELKEYSTPYLEAAPSNIICNGQSVSINVITLDATNIQWLPPFSGSSLSQTVTQAGVYQCYVTMCGIQTLCSITIAVSNPVASISAASASFCPGDSLLLTAGAGAYSYEWQPGFNQNNSLYTNVAGTYSLTVTDAYGCQDATSYTVSLNTSTTQPTAAASYTLCYGDSAIVTANAGSLPIEWYADAQLQNFIGAGSPFTTPVYFSDTVIYASAVGSGSCNSLGTAVVIDVNNNSIPPVISGDTSVCSGNTISLFGSSSSTTFNWTGPNGFTSAQQNPVILNAAVPAGGTYTLTTQAGNCPSPFVTWSVSVSVPVAPVISGSDTVCSGDPLVLYSGLSSPTVVTWTAPSNAFIVTGDSLYLLPPQNISGWYSAQANTNGCIGAADSFYVQAVSVPAVTVGTVNSPLCEGDTAWFLADTVAGATYFWQGPGGFTTTIQNPVLYNVTSSQAGIYSMSAVIGSCYSNPLHLFLNVQPLLLIDLGTDTTMCYFDSLVLAPGSYASYLWQNGSSDSSFSVHFSGMYSVIVTDQYGCTDMDTINILFDRCEPGMVNVFTPNGDGKNDLFFFSGEFFNAVKCSVFDRWGLLMYEWDGVSGAWDGTNMYSGNPVSEGTYFYIAEVRDYKDKLFRLQGYITLSR